MSTSTSARTHRMKHKQGLHGKRFRVRRLGQIGGVLPALLALSVAGWIERPAAPKK